MSEALNLEGITREVEYAHQVCEEIFGVNAFSVKEVAADFARWASSTRPLGAGETGVVSLLRPKVTALFSDRVWLRYAGEDPKLDFGFGWESPIAVRLAALFAFLSTEAVEESDGLTDDGKRFLSVTEADLAQSYALRSGALVTPLYSSPSQRDGDYKPGNLAVITSIIENVAVASEDALTWEQVVEFRRDATARSRYARFIHWLDKEMTGKSESFVREAIAARLEQYEWALRKHGIQTVLGALERTISASSVLSSVTAGAAVQYISQQPLLATFAGAGLLIANAAVYATTALIAREDILLQNKEIALVHDVKRTMQAVPVCAAV